MENEDLKTEVWAIVELFGHSQISGVISSQTIGGASFVRIDVPETKTQPAFTRTLNPSAIYAFNWCTKEVAISHAEGNEVKPVTFYDIQKAADKMVMSLEERNANGGDDMDF